MFSAKEYVQEQAAAWRDARPRTSTPQDSDKMDVGFSVGGESHWQEGDEPDGEADEIRQNDSLNA